MLVLFGILELDVDDAANVIEAGVDGQFDFFAFGSFNFEMFPAGDFVEDYVNIGRTGQPTEK